MLKDIKPLISMMTDAASNSDFSAVTAAARQLEFVLNSNPLVCEICGSNASAYHTWTVNNRLVCDQCLYLRKVECEHTEINPDTIAFSELETIIIEIEEENETDPDLILSSIETIQHCLEKRIK